MKKTSHHHGDLYNALVTAGLEILQEQGLDGLTLRKAAARAGVSHAAPAHHFDGKEGLLIAIATHGFEVFRHYMLEDRYKSGQSPRDQLVGISRGYLRFSTEHRALFQLIFTVEYKTHSDPKLENASAAAYQVLRDVCALFEPSPLGEQINELRVWSVVHGYATLSLFQRGRTPDEGEPVPIELLLPDLLPLEQ